MAVYRLSAVMHVVIYTPVPARPIFSYRMCGRRSPSILYYTSLKKQTNTGRLQKMGGILKKYKVRSEQARRYTYVIALAIVVRGRLVRFLGLSVDGMLYYIG